MSSFGEKLRGERERRNTAIEEIAGTTKIQLSYLEALEHNEFDALPGPAFGKLYIRAYAEVLGFDPRPLIDDYDRERQNRVSKESSRGQTTRPGPMAPEDRARARQERFAKVLGGERARSGSRAPTADPVAATVHEDATRHAAEAATNESEENASVEPGVVRPPATDAGRPAEIAADRVAVTSHEVESREAADARTTESEETDSLEPGVVRAPVTAAADTLPATIQADEEAADLLTTHHEEEQPLESVAAVDIEDVVASDEPELPIDGRAIDDTSVASVEAPEAGLEEDSEREFDPTPKAITCADANPDAADAANVAAVEVEDPRPKKRSSLGLPIAVVSATLLLVVIVWISLGDRPREAQPGVSGEAEAAKPTEAITEPDESIAASLEKHQAPGALRDPATDRSTAVTPPAKPVRVPPDAALAAPSSNELSVSEFGVGRRIVNHRLEERGVRFEEGSVVWFSTRVLGGTSGEQIRHVWFRNGKAVQSIELPLGGPHWRTHSQKTLWGTGSWSVEARDASDTVLARAEFSCVP
jgi:hypothetical protein